MTRWDNLHERYFNYLGTLSFDKAKELLDKDGNKMSNDLLQYFHSLIQYERSYHNFGFIGQKGNLSTIRKDKTLFQCYSDLHMSLIEVQTNNKQVSDDAKEVQPLEQLTNGLLSFLQIRTNLMKLYEQISSEVKRNERNVRLENYLSDVKSITQTDMSTLNMSILQPINRLLRYEIDCLHFLTQSYMFICDYHYMNSISALHQMFCVLKEWNDNIENQTNTMHRFMITSPSPLNFFKSTSKPALYTFYSKFHESLVAKFTLYFYDILCEYSGSESKIPAGKTSPDFATRISQFYRRANAEWIFLILHKTSEPNPSSEIVEQISLSINDDKPYQIIYSHPSKPNLTDEVTQTILTKVSINKETLLNGEKLFYSGDANQTKTYFLQNIDPRMTFVLIFANHRQERDTTITNFLNEIIDLLRGSKQLLYFKTPLK